MCRPRLLALLIAAAAADAAAQSTGVSCSGSNVAFSLGAYDSYQGVPMDASTVFTVTCSRGGGPQNNTITVGVGPSLNSGTTATRQLKLTTGADLLNYNLYRDAGRALVWGNTIGTNTVSQNISIPNNGSNTATFTLFGRIDALQDVRPGSYADTLTFTVTF